MAADKFTVVVVGAGPAGGTAAYLLAQAGLEVLLVERGAEAGRKNMFGGRMYSWALNQVLPGFWEEAPLQRPVTREVITVMTERQSVAITCQDAGWGEAPVHSYTVLRAEFDAWLAAKAEEAGAILATGIRVDDVIRENGRVIGVRAGDDEILAEVVIAADGALALLAEKAGVTEKPKPRQIGLGVKQIIELDAPTVEQRFQIAATGGVAGLYVGSVTRGMNGGGFIYTNKDSVSLGLVINAAEFSERQVPVAELLAAFKQHPAVAPLIAGGQVTEYAAHLVPEAGWQRTSRLFDDGLLVTGDAAGLVINLGYQVRGMDLAIASGAAAAQTVIQAAAAADFSRQQLSGYQRRLQTGILRDMELYARAPHFLANQRLYSAYPQLLNAITARVFEVNGEQPEHLLTKVQAQIKHSGIGLRNLLGDAWKGVKSL